MLSQSVSQSFLVVLNTSLIGLPGAGGPHTRPLQKCLRQHFCVPGQSASLRHRSIGRAHGGRGNGVTILGQFPGFVSARNQLNHASNDSNISRRSDHLSAKWRLY